MLQGVQNRIGHKKHILLIDDEKSLTQMLTMLLETRGYEVKVANTASEALQKVSADYDLILLDLVLPDATGFEVCRTLKKQKNTRHIPIIVLSAHSVYEDKVEALYLGADDFVSKPCENEELFARMEAVIRRAKHYEVADPCRDPKTIIGELRHIIDEALIIPHFQPIYTFTPPQLYGIEILTRPNTQGVLINPEILFEAALQYGLYSELEILSWSMAVGALSKFLREEKIFLNCSPYFIESSQFLRVKAMLEKNHVPASHVVLEITERSAISDFKLFYDQLNNYREYGFHFAVDDVGGGYASLESIVEIKPEVVKIDRHIVKDSSADVFKQSIIKFIVSLCRENHIIVVAEGIETSEDLAVVRDLGVEAGQGYHLYRPTPQINLPDFAHIHF